MQIHQKYFYKIRLFFLCVCVWVRRKFQIYIMSKNAHRIQNVCHHMHPHVLWWRWWWWRIDLAKEPQYKNLKSKFSSNYGSFKKYISKSLSYKFYICTYLPTTYNRIAKYFICTQNSSVSLYRRRRRRRRGKKGRRKNRLFLFRYNFCVCVVTKTTRSALLNWEKHFQVGKNIRGKNRRISHSSKL